MLCSPSSLRQKSKEKTKKKANHDNINNKMSLTSISLLDRTHLYDKFAVRERYHAAFAVTCFVCVSEGSCCRRHIISPMIVLSIHQKCFPPFLAPTHTT